MGCSHLLPVDSLNNHAAPEQLQLHYYHLTVALGTLSHCKKRWCSNYSQAGIAATCGNTPPVWLLYATRFVSIPKTDAHRHICRNTCTLWKTEENSGIPNYTWLCKDYNCEPCHRCCRHGTFDTRKQIAILKWIQLFKTILTKKASF